MCKSEVICCSILWHVILLGKAISAASGFWPYLDFIGFAQSDFTYVYSDFIFIWHNLCFYLWILGVCLESLLKLEEVMMKEMPMIYVGHYSALPSTGLEKEVYRNSGKNTNFECKTCSSIFSSLTQIGFWYGIDQRLVEQEMIPLFVSTAASIVSFEVIPVCKVMQLLKERWS